MKRFLSLLTFILLTFAFIPEVRADECDIIYNISSVDFDGSKISFSGYGLLHDTNNYSPEITITAYKNGQEVKSVTTNGSHGDYTSDYRQKIPSVGNTPDLFDYENVEFDDLELDLGEHMTCEQGGGSSEFTFGISVNSNGGGSCGTVSSDMYIFENAVKEEDRGKIIAGQITSGKIVPTDGRVKDESGNTVEDFYSWENNGIYDVTGIIYPETNNSDDRRFLVELPYGYGNNSTSDGSGKCVPVSDPSKNNPVYVDPSGAECKGFAKSNWMQFSGNSAATFSMECDETPSECRSNINLGLTCSDGTFNATCAAESYSVPVEWVHEVDGGESVGCIYNVPLSQSVSSTVTRTEIGRLSFSLPSETFLSGTGFPFSVSYANETWYTHNYDPVCPGFWRGETKSHQRCTSWGVRGCTSWETYYTCDFLEYDSGMTQYGTCQYDSVASAKHILAYEIASRYQGLNSTGSVMFDDGGTSGGWSCSSDNPDYWPEGMKVNAYCSYTLDNAYIHRKTAEIVYGSVGNVEDYLDRGKLYYIPLDWPTGTFGVHGQFNNLAVQGMASTFNWNASYSCGVNCINRWDCYDEDCPGVIDCLLPEYAAAHPDICNPESLCEDPEYASAHPEECDGYDDDDNGNQDCSDATYREEHPVECANDCSNPEYYYQNKDLCDARPGDSEHSFGFIYRPIDLYDPFPNRLAGYNWREWYSNSANQNRLETTYGVVATPEKLNYSIHLDPEHLNRIREYNDFVGTYLDYSINNDGTSEFFKVEKSGVPLEPSTNGIQGGNCPLGEYNETCGSVTGR